MFIRGGLARFFFAATAVVDGYGVSSLVIGWI
jgi:hypothetical protein